MWDWFLFSLYVLLVVFIIIDWFLTLKFWCKSRKLTVEDVFDKHVHVIDCQNRNEKNTVYVISTANMTVRELELMMRKLIQGYEVKGERIGLKKDV